MDRYMKANAVLSLFSKQYMELKKGLPVRPSEMGVLNIITATEGQYTPVMLADMLGISKPMITAHITALRNKGYVTKVPSSSDKRAYYLRPTESGRELVASAREDLNKHLQLMEKQMGKEIFDTFLHFANTAYEIMKRERLRKKMSNLNKLGLDCIDLYEPARMDTAIPLRRSPRNLVCGALFLRTVRYLWHNKGVSVCRTSRSQRL